MNELQEQLRSGPIPLDNLVAALHRTTAALGTVAVMDESTQDRIGQELYAMALEEPEWEVFT